LLKDILAMLAKNTMSFRRLPIGESSSQKGDVTEFRLRDVIDHSQLGLIE